MDPFTLIFLGFLWFLFSSLRKAQQQAKRPRPQAPLPSPGTADSTQREGSRLEAMIRELERTLTEAAEPYAPPTPPTPPRSRPHPAALPLPPAEEVEERETLEREAEVVSLEQEVRRQPRARVALDDRAEQIEEARVAAAAARSGSLTQADHAAFDARIRQQPADATAVRTPTLEQLRRAVIWREILGPPVGERPPSKSAMER